MNKHYMLSLYYLGDFNREFVYFINKFVCLICNFRTFMKVNERKCDVDVGAR